MQKRGRGVGSFRFDIWSLTYYRFSYCLSLLDVYLSINQSLLYLSSSFPLLISSRFHLATKFSQFSFARRLPIGPIRPGFARCWWQHPISCIWKFRSAQIESKLFRQVLGVELERFSKLSTSRFASFFPSLSFL